MPTEPPSPAQTEQSAAPPRLALSPREAAAALGIGERLLWEWTNRGEIPSMKLGTRTLYPVDALREWLRERATGAGGGERR